MEIYLAFRKITDTAALESPAWAHNPASLSIRRRAAESTLILPALREDGGGAVTALVLVCTLLFRFPW